MISFAAGTYIVYVRGFVTNGQTIDFTLYNWILGPSAAGNIAISSPAAATNGTSGSVELSFSGLA